MQLEHGFLAGWTRICERAAGAESRVVDQQGQAGRSRYPLRQQAHIGIDCEIGGKDLDLHPMAFFEALSQGFEPVGVARHHDEVVAPGRELLAEHFADSGGRAGYNREWPGLVAFLVSPLQAATGRGLERALAWALG